MSHRYFTTAISSGEARITGPDAAHLSRVLRVRPGEILTLCDGAGFDYDAAVVSANSEEVVLQILSRSPSNAEPSLWAEVFLGVAKGDRMEWAIQKSVELGASAIVPFFSQNCVVKPKNEEEKRLRYARIAQEAAKQCGRGILPGVETALPFSAMLKRAAQNSLALFCYEGGGKPLREVLGASTKRVALITGAEGGFSPEEARQAAESGCIAINLGPRILRAETAPVAALAALMALSGNLE